MNKSDKHLHLISLAVTGILIWLSLSLSVQRGLWSSLETQSAQIAREFLEGGEWIVPHLNGAEDSEKPAFFFWLIALFSALTGSVSEFSSRLPSFLGALLVPVLFFSVQKKLKIPALALVSSAIFLSSPKVFWMTQVARMDMVFSCLCFSSLIFFFFYTQEESEKRKVFYSCAFFASSGLAVLCKGPIGLLLPFFPVLFFCLRKKPGCRIRSFFSLRGVAIFVLLVLPWYSAVIVKTEGRFFTKFFLSDNIGRFLGPSSIPFSEEFSKRQPLWFYIPHFVGGFFPWSLFFLAFLCRSVKAKKPSPVESLLTIYVIFILVFFSLAGVKRSDYILPVYPAASLLAAHYAIQAASPKTIKNLFFLSAGSLLVFTGILLGLSFLSADLADPFFSRHFPPADLQKAELFLDHLNQIFPHTLSVFALMGSFFIFAAVRKSRTFYLAALLSMLTCLLLYGGLATLSVINPKRDVRPFCSAVRPVISDHDLRFYGFWNDELVFYLDRFIDPRTPDKGMGKDELFSLMKQKDKKIFFLVRKKDYERLLEQGLKPAYVASAKSPVLYPVYLMANFYPQEAD
ncbi:MAG: glycosyltransferase family 39 protein [Candidatus Aureabacteria bacterium]|nr:glycosyltransferase family 39 protein [Candidatus Auribacterota bacterium]